MLPVNVFMSIFDSAFSQNGRPFFFFALLYLNWQILHRIYANIFSQKNQHNTQKGDINC